MSYPLSGAGRGAEPGELAWLAGGRPSAEDVVQDVFARLCGRDLLPAGDGAVAYVRATVLNRCAARCASGQLSTHV
jgi:DNA-directed RNA polymerase specialized sigma24 family protein